MANRGAPTPPIAIEGAGLSRLTADRVEVDGALLTRLQSVCEVAAGDAEHGRDWWPLAMRWALEGDVPAVPAVVARPTSTGEVAALLAVCNEARVPVTAAAGRSGVCGASVPLHGGVALDLCGLAGIVDLDDESLLLSVRAGTFGDVLEDELRATHGVTLGHWPQSIALSTVGGWVACRGAGQLSTRYGKIEDMVRGLEVVLADGSVVRTGGRGPRTASGPDLNQVFVGSEGTLGVITEATLRVHPAPAAEQRAAFAFGSFADGLDACRRVLRRGATPAVLRLYDGRESERSFGVGREVNALIVMDEGDEALVAATMAVVAEECAAGDALDVSLVERWLSHRNDVSGLEAAIRQGIVVDTVEIAAPWAPLPRIHEEVTAAVKAVDGIWLCTCHQSHAYTDGACLYFTFAGQRDDDPDGLYRDAWDAATRATLALGGALSHHHGVGLNRSRFVREALGSAYGVLTALKVALDPKGILNPGKLGLADPFGEARW